MPFNPFDLGSTEGVRAIDARSRAARAYSKEARTAVGVTRQWARAERDAATVSAARARAQKGEQALHQRDLKLSSGLLDQQRLILKNLSEVRRRAYEEEHEHQRSLAQDYEKVKTYLKEIQQDTQDTSTLLGSMYKNVRLGVDQFLRVGDISDIATPVRDVQFSLDDLGGSLDRAAGKAGDMTTAVGKAVPAIGQYYLKLGELDERVGALALTYNDADGATQQLAASLTQLGRINIIEPGAVDSIEKTTDSLKFLEAQGVATGDSLSYVVEQSQRTSESFEDTAQQLETFGAYADEFQEQIGKSHRGLKAFTFSIREDFIKAMMEMSRQFNSQVVDLQNVASAYQYAARKAVEFGATGKSAGTIAKGFTDVLFDERQDAFTFLAGRSEQADVLKQYKDFLKQATDAGMDAEQAASKARTDLARSLYGIEGEVSAQKLADVEQVLETARDGGGLGPMDIANLLRTTKTGIEHQLESIKGIIGSTKDQSVRKRLIESNFGVQMSTAESLRFSKLLLEGRADKVADEILKLRKDAEDRATSEKDAMKNAITTVLTIKDPIQQLFNIKDYVKLMALNLNNIFKFVKYIGEHIPGLDSVPSFDDITADLSAVLGRDQQQEDTRLQQTISQISQDRQSLIDSITETSSAYNEAAEGSLEKQQLGEELEGLQKRLNDSIVSSARQLSQFSSRQGSAIAQAAQDVQSAARATQEAADSERPTLAVADLASLAASGPISDALRQSTSQRTVPPSVAVAPATPGPQAVTQPTGPTQPGVMIATGVGKATVGSDGKARMQVTMEISNMEEVVAFANEKAKFYNQFGIG